MTTSTPVAPPVNLGRVEHIKITAREGETSYVHADYYAAVVDERDTLRRELAMINAWRLHHAASIDEPAASTLDRLLADVGQTVAVGNATLGIAASLGIANPKWV